MFRHAQLKRIEEIMTVAMLRVLLVCESVELLNMIHRN